MPEPLKFFFSLELVDRIAQSIVAVHPRFPVRRFIDDAVRGLEELELLARAQHIANALHTHLPPRYADAIQLIVRSLGPEHATDELEGVGMAPFFYLPHSIFVSTYGMDDFQASMNAQHEITRRFSCEFSIRPFLDRYPDATLAMLRTWATDKKPHVRRLVSEGTRPRLPWATRVPFIEKEPHRVLPLLELLKDDPASVVRRSVANHLNDLTKSAPDLAYDVVERWNKDAPPQRRALICHALRSAIKRGDPRALDLLGFGAAPKVEISTVLFEPKRLRIGAKTRITLTLCATAARTQSLVVDLVVHFIKANGKPSRKVFKLSRVTLKKNDQVTLSKVISLAVHTTRKPYPGRHAVEALINGRTFPLGAFTVLAPRRGS